MTTPPAIIHVSPYPDWPIDPGELLAAIQERFGDQADAVWDLLAHVKSVLGSLDVAWAEVEAALPEGWIVGGLYHAGPSPMMRGDWEAVAWGPWQRSSRSCESVSGYAPDRGDALLALAASLRDNR